MHVYWECIHYDYSQVNYAGFDIILAEFIKSNKYK